MADHSLIAEDTLEGFRDIQAHINAGELVALRHERDHRAVLDRLYDLHELLVLAHAAVTRNIEALCHIEAAAAAWTPGEGSGGEEPGPSGCRWTAPVSPPGDRDMTERGA